MRTIIKVALSATLLGLVTAGANANPLRTLTRQTFAAGGAQLQAPAHGTLNLARVAQVLRADTLNGAQSAAQTALQQIASVVGTGDYRSLGFAHANDIQRATLGSPIRTVFLPLDKLASYEDGKDAVPYIDDSDGLIFPILVDGKVTSGIWMAKQGTGWTMVGIGQPNKVKELEATRSSVASANNVDRGTLFDVEVPALDLAFIGRAQSNKLRMTPIEDMPTFGLTANHEIDAETALHYLSPAARNYEPVGVR